MGRMMAPRERRASWVVVAVAAGYRSMMEEPVVARSCTSLGPEAECCRSMAGEPGSSTSLAHTGWSKFPEARGWSRSRAARCTKSRAWCTSSRCSRTAWRGTRSRSRSSLVYRSGPNHQGRRRNGLRSSRARCLRSVPNWSSLWLNNIRLGVLATPALALMASIPAGTSTTTTRSCDRCADQGERDKRLSDHCVGR